MTDSLASPQTSTGRSSRSMAEEGRSSSTSHATRVIPGNVVGVCHAHCTSAVTTSASAPTNFGQQSFVVDLLVIAVYVSRIKLSGNTAPSRTSGSPGR